MEIAFEPYKKISFNSHLKYESAEEFGSVIAMSHPPGVAGLARLFWANGILFRFFNHAPSEAMSKEIITGHWILDHIEFAPMAEFKNELKVPERPLVMINILNVSNHAVFDPLTEWIRDNLT